MRDDRIVRVIAPQLKTALYVLSGSILAFLILTILHTVAAALPPDFQESVVASGLQQPTTMRFSPDGRLFVAEKAGRLRIIKNGQLLATPFVNLPVNTSSERGLLGIAFDPNFATNRTLYLYYTNNSPLKNRVSSFRASVSNPDLVEAGSETVILDDIFVSAGNHNGGAIHFGQDGKLYIAVGDNAVSANAQTLTNLLGKILRINSNGTIPSDNPFVGTSGARGEIWALGLRNPYTFAVDPGSSRIYVNDVGQNTWEEVNQLARGANYGWPTCEGVCSATGMTNPIYAYAHPEGFAITGGVFYRGSQFPASYTGVYFFSDYIGNFIRGLNQSNQMSAFATGVDSPVSLETGPDGTLYYLAFSGGAVRRITYTGTAPNQAPVAVNSPSATSGTVPLNVNFSGGQSSDSDGDTLTYSWNFGDGSPTASGVTTSHTYSTPGVFTSTLTVSDGRGGTNSASRQITVTGQNTAPVGTIVSPGNGALYSAGDTISFSGTATDSQDGTLPASAFSWSVAFHHDTHSHPFLGPLTQTRTGSFQIPKLGETSANVWYRIQLTVTDSQGAIHQSTRDVLPRKSTFTLQTSPAGLTVTLDGQPQTAPKSVEGVVGTTRAIGTLAPQTLNGITYNFALWSDSGQLVHTIDTPLTNTTFTAVFMPAVVVPSDVDGDGAPDTSDNCPAVSNADQADADGDGVGDLCDAAPHVLRDLNGDGSSDLVLLNNTAFRAFLSEPQEVGSGPTHEGSISRVMKVGVGEIDGTGRAKVISVKRGARSTDKLSWGALDPLTGHKVSLGAFGTGRDTPLLGCAIGGQFVPAAMNSTRRSIQLLTPGTSSGTTVSLPKGVTSASCVMTANGDTLFLVLLNRKAQLLSRDGAKVLETASLPRSISSGSYLALPASGSAPVNLAFFSRSTKAIKLLVYDRSQSAWRNSSNSLAVPRAQQAVAGAYANGQTWFAVLTTDRKIWIGKIDGTTVSPPEVSSAVRVKRGEAFLQ